MEKRSVQRDKIPMRALLSFSDAPTQMLKTRNISAGGAFFVTDRARPEGTAVFMSLFLHTAPGKQVRDRNVAKVRGKVMRRSDYGMAVCFDQRCYRFPWM